MTERAKLRCMMAGHRIAMAENIKLFLDGRPVPLLVGRSQQGGQS
jgi:hypothetical protein